MHRHQQPRRRRFRHCFAPMGLGAVVLVLGACGDGSANAAAERDAPEVPEAYADTLAIGTVLHYVKTNLDGTQPEHVSLRVASPHSIEVYKYHPGEAPAGLVTAQFDSARTLLLGLRSIQRRGAEETVDVAAFVYDPATRRGALQIFGNAMDVEFTQHPFTVYAFEMAELNVLMPRRADPLAPWPLMLVDLSYDAEVPTLYERGPVTLRYEEDEERGDVATRRYSMTGEGLGESAATVWFDRGAGFVREIESPVANHPMWQSYRLRLERVDSMSADEWQRFQVEQIRPRSPSSP